MAGVTTEYKNDYISDSILSIQKIRDVHKEHILQERIAECDMDIQTILSGNITPKVVSIVDKYNGTCSNMMKVASSSCFEDGGQSITRRKSLQEAMRDHNSCQELHEICRVGNWIFPRYIVIPLVSDGMYQASVRLARPDFQMNISGVPCLNPREARCSVAAHMILELHKKAKEEEQEDT